KTECPSSVDMAKIKTEFLAHYYEDHRVPLRARMMAGIHDMSKLASHTPRLANLGMRSPVARAVQSRIGIHPERRLSPFATRTFEQWWKAHRARRHSQPLPTRGEVVYFHDTF